MNIEKPDEAFDYIEDLIKGFIVRFFNFVLNYEIEYY